MLKEDTFIVETTMHERLDVYLASKLKFSRSKIKKFIESGLVEVNGIVRSSHYKIIEGEKITYQIPDDIKNGAGSDTQLSIRTGPILYQDKHFAVIDKPPDLVVHPAPGNKSSTLLNGLIKKFKEPHLVHRLDKDTSGLLIVALDEKTALNIREQFKEKEVKKVYVAIVKGIIKEEAGEISVPIKRSRRDPTKMSVGYSHARDSTTRFKVKERLNGATFVEIYPLSGRTHQIRVHFAYYGYPVLGDRKYGGESIRTVPILPPRQMLHAWQISFKEPETEKRIHFEAPVPDDFKRILSGLKI